LLVEALQEENEEVLTGIVFGEIISNWICGFTGFKGWLASLDSRRLVVFGAYGLVITGPFFHWWYGYLESLSTSTVGLLSRNKGIQKQPLLQFAVKLGLNQLVMTPPFLLFTLAYIQYFLSLDVDQTVKAVKRSFAAALFTNWKVIGLLLISFPYYDDNLWSGVDCCSSDQLPVGPLGVSGPVRQCGGSVVEHLSEFGE